MYLHEYFFANWPGCRYCGWAKFWQILLSSRTQLWAENCVGYTISSLSYQYTSSFSRGFFSSKLMQSMPVSALPVYFDIKLCLCNILDPTVRACCSWAYWKSMEDPASMWWSKFVFTIFLFCQGLSWAQPKWQFLTVYYLPALHLWIQPSQQDSFFSSIGSVCRPAIWCV